MASDNSELSDAAHTLVGFAILGFQRLQVKRRALEGEARSAVDSLLRHGAEWVNENESRSSRD